MAPTITFSSLAVTEDSGNNITHLVYVYHSRSAQDSKLDGVVALCDQLIEKTQGVNRIITTPSGLGLIVQNNQPHNLHG